MTTPDERTKSVLDAQGFLFELLSSEAYPDLPDTVRWKVRHLLRHYPRTLDIKLAALALPGWFATPLDDEAASGGEPG